MMFLFCTRLCPQYLKRPWLILVGQHSMVNNRWMIISQFIREQDHGQNITLWNLTIVLDGLVSYLKLIFQWGWMSRDQKIHMTCTFLNILNTKQYFVSIFISSSFTSIYIYQNLSKIHFWIKLSKYVLILYCITRNLRFHLKFWCHTMSYMSYMILK